MADFNLTGSTVRISPGPTIPASFSTLEIFTLGFKALDTPESASTLVKFTLGFKDPQLPTLAQLNEASPGAGGCFSTNSVTASVACSTQTPAATPATGPHSAVTPVVTIAPTPCLKTSFAA